MKEHSVSEHEPTYCPGYTVSPLHDHQLFRLKVLAESMLIINGEKETKAAMKHDDRDEASDERLI